MLASVGLSSLFLLSGLVAAVAAGAQEGDATRSDLQPVADCIRNNGRAAVALLIDESGSLQDTDPDNARVTGVKATLAALNELTQGEAPVEVHVGLWGFSVAGEERQDWARLTSDSLGDLQGQADQFAERNRGFDTDYIAALQTARLELADHVVAMDPDGSSPVCKLLLWFSDGKLDVDDRRSASAQDQYGTTKGWAPDIDLTQPGGGDLASARGRELMCQPDGLMQQVRNDGIFTAVVALETDIAEPDRAFLRASAQGTGGEVTCGDPGPASVRAGAYVPVSDVDGLIFDMFGVVAPPPVPPGVAETGNCPSDEPCPQGTHEFVLDASLNRFNLLAVAEDRSIKVLLTAPDGSRTEVTGPGAGEAAIAGADLNWSWLSPTTVLVAGSLDARDTAWAGTWKVTFVDTTGENPGAVNRLAVYLFGDLEARVEPDTRLRKGEEGTLSIGIVNAEGQPLTPDAFVEGTTVSATIGLPGEEPQDLPLTSLGDGTYEATYTPATDTEAIAANVHTDLTVQTSIGVALPTVGTDQTVPLDPPVGFPPVDLGGADALVLSAVREADGTAEGELVLQGAPEGDACVWLRDVEVTTVPERLDGVEHSFEQGGGEDDCISVPAGEEVRIGVRADVAGAARGRVEADLTVAMRSDEAGRTIDQTVPTRFEMAIPPVVDGTTFGLLFLLGVGVPLALMYALNFAAAHYEEFDTIRTITVRGVVGPGGIRRLDGKSPLLQGDDFKTLPEPESLREFTWGSFQFRARKPWSPWGAVTGRVSAGERLVVSNRGLLQDGREAQVALGLGLVWVAAAGTEGLANAGRTVDGGLDGDVDVELLVLFAVDESFGRQVERVEDDIRRRLPSLVAALVDKAAAAAPAAEPRPDGPVPAELGGDPGRPPGGVDLPGPGGGPGPRRPDGDLPPLPGGSPEGPGHRSASRGPGPDDRPPGGPPEDPPFPPSPGGGSLPPLPGS